MKSGVVDKKEKNWELDMAAAHYLSEPSEENLSAMVCAGEKLVRYFVRIYGGGYSGDDLVQVGTEGMLKALKGFDKYNGASFTTYAGHCIMGEIRHYVRKEVSYYRPGCITDIQYQIGSLIDESLKQTGCVPSVKTISEILNIQQESINEVMKAGMVSLDEVELNKIHSLRHKSFHLPIEERIALEQAIRKLSELQQKVLNMLFFNSMTQQEASEQLGINQRKVSRIKEKCLDSLRSYLSDE